MDIAWSVIRLVGTTDRVDTTLPNMTTIREDREEEAVDGEVTIITTREEEEAVVTVRGRTIITVVDMEAEEDTIETREDLIRISTSRIDTEEWPRVVDNSSIIKVDKVVDTRAMVGIRDKEVATGGTEVDEVAVVMANRTTTRTATKVGLIN